MLLTMEWVPEIKRITIKSAQKVNILTSDKKTSEKPYTIWSREEAINGDQWIETNLNLLEELNELRPKKGRRVGRRKVRYFII